MVLKSSISRIFGQSPVQPLQQHIQTVYECAALLKPFFENIYSENWDEVNKIRDQITALEREADDIKKEIRLHLPKGIFLPVSRRDLLGMLSNQDKIANKAKDISGIVLGRRMQFPESIQAPYLSFVARSIDACAQAVTTVNELDELLETGFRGAELELVEAMINKLDEIEHDTDKIQINIRAQLMAIEETLPAVEVMFLYKVIEATGDLGDLAQRVGSRLELLLAS